MCTEIRARFSPGSLLGQNFLHGSSNADTKGLSNQLYVYGIQDILFKGLIDFMERHQTIPNPICNVHILLHLNANKQNLNEI